MWIRRLPTYMLHWPGSTHARHACTSLQRCATASYPCVSVLDRLTGKSQASCNMQETELLAAGFPCVDISRAGNRAGLDGQVHSHIRGCKSVLSHVRLAGSLRDVATRCFAVHLKVAPRIAELRPRQACVPAPGEGHGETAPGANGPARECAVPDSCLSHSLYVAVFKLKEPVPRSACISHARGS